MENELEGLVRVGMSFALSVKKQEAGVTREVRLMTKYLETANGERTLKLESNRVPGLILPELLSQ